MAYFNHAFTKAFYAKTQNQTTTETTADLGGGGALGEFAFADASYKIMNAAGVAGTAGGFYLAQSSFQTVDTIGNNPGHGGYSESHKSKMILKKYVSDMWISTCENEAASVYGVIIKPTAAAKSCFPCGTDPIMRVDIKGTAALRLLNHNAYQSLSGSLPMAPAGATLPANGVDMCCVTQDSTHSGIAPSIVAVNFRDQFNNDPIMSKLGTAKVQISTTAVPTYTDITTAQETAIYAGGASGVTINAAAASATGDWVATDLYKVVFTLFTSCELQTQFTSCSFDTRDFYLMGGLKVIADLQDEVGQPCVACQGYVIPAEITTFKQRRTSSDTAINAMLLTESYKQSPYNQGNRDSSRFREQEGMSGIVTEMGRDSTTDACNGMYRVYHLLHNVPRFNNPSGVFDNDQYHYKVYVKCSGSAAATATLDADWLAIAIDASIMKFDGASVVSTVADLEAKGGDY
jgi:hypothetical protein|tara:strand:+ start:1332 stop:2714 length:1383 start_codon:yes stop_codon:yes gene_type:complete